MFDSVVPLPPLFMPSNEEEATRPTTRDCVRPSSSKLTLGYPLRPQGSNSTTVTAFSPPTRFSFNYSIPNPKIFHFPILPCPDSESQLCYCYSSSLESNPKEKKAKNGNILFARHECFLASSTTITCHSSSYY